MSYLRGYHGAQLWCTYHYNIMDHLQRQIDSLDAKLGTTTLKRPTGSNCQEHVNTIYQMEDDICNLSDMLNKNDKSE